MRKIARTTVLPAPADEVWRLVQRPDTLRFVSAPVLMFRPLDGPLPETWAEGDYEVALRLFGLVPLGRQTIGVRRVAASDGARRLRDAGRGQLAKTWDHVITIVPQGAETRYSDEVTIDAGWLTGPVAFFARLFYAHRQRRWRKLLAGT